MRPRLSCPYAGVLRHDERTSRSFLPQARGWRATGKMGSHGAFWWSCTGWRRGAPAWFTWISWLGAAPAAGGVQAQGLGSSRPLRIQGVAPCVLNTDNPADRRQEVMWGAGWARASNLRDLYACRWTSQPGLGVRGEESKDQDNLRRCVAFPHITCELACPSASEDTPHANWKPRCGRSLRRAWPFACGPLARRRQTPHSSTGCAAL